MGNSNNINGYDETSYRCDSSSHMSDSVWVADRGFVRKMAALKLFESDDDTDEISNLEIDQKFKARHEYNEKRKDLHRLEELEKNEMVDSDNESSESEAEEFDDDDDDDDIKKLMDLLVKVKNQDPIIKQKDAKLFESEDEESEEESDKKETKSKPKYLKDVIAEKLLEDGGEDEDDDDSRVRPRGKSYNQEQEVHRKKFLDVVKREFDDDDDEEDLLKEKKRGKRRRMQRTRRLRTNVMIILGTMGV
ncbi:protein KRI1 homolog [Papaver somniferum]|uniref:protein KRI1 homolog n=1 Tax=Papaver somniferum TaxID=3469 RepID=UPI000E70429D|nr:protein KRI1 homolog [Papaver somniferum]